MERVEKSNQPTKAQPSGKVRQSQAKSGKVRQKQAKAGKSRQKQAKACKSKQNGLIEKILKIFCIADQAVAARRAFFKRKKGELNALCDFEAISTNFDKGLTKKSARARVTRTRPIFLSAKAWHHLQERPNLRKKKNFFFLKKKLGIISKSDQI